MAIMNKMREKMTVIFAGLAGAFLLMIVFEWGAQGDFFKSGPKRADEIGEVNGLPITNQSYQDMFQGLRQQKLSETKKSSLTDAEESEVMQKAWDQALTEVLIDQKLKEYGITVTDQEVRDKMFYDPPEEMRRNPSFFDSTTGRFNQQAYWSVLRDPRYDTIIGPYTIRVREAMKREKLQSILLSTVRLTNSYMWERFEIQNAKATFDVVRIAPPQTEFSNFISKVTDDEIQKYYDDHKWEYKQDEGRKIKFVMFREVPTAHDSAAVYDRAVALSNRWKAMPITEKDSTVMELARDYTDNPYQADLNLDPRILGSLSNPDSILNAKTGDVVICPTTNGQLRELRVTSSLDTGEELVHAKTIIIGKGSNPDSAKALIDKIYDQLQHGGNFAELARQYSIDPTARQGGDARWTPAKVFAEDILSKLDKAPTNTVQGPFELPLAYQIVVLIGRTHKKVHAQAITLDVKASAATSKMAQQQATIFSEQAKKKGFDQAAKDMELRVIPDAPPLLKKGSQPLFGYQPFTNYIFTLSSGDITVPVHIQSARMTVVAQVTEIIPKGTRPLDEELKRSLRTQVAKQKMVASVAQKAQQVASAIGSSGDLTRAASVDPTLQVIRITSGPAESTPQLGTEYALNNAVFALQPGQTTQLVKGEAGYFIAKLIELKPADKNEFDKEKPKLFQQLSEEEKQRFFMKWLEDLKDNAEVKDFRIAHQ